MKFGPIDTISTLKENIKRIGANKTANQAMIFSFFSFLNSGISFFLLIIIAGFISPEGYGYLNLFNISVTLFGFFICLNTTGIITLAYFQGTRQDMNRTISAVFSLTLLCLLLLGGVILLWGDEIQTATGISPIYQWIALCICFFQVFTTVNLDIWRLEEKPLAYGTYSSALAILNFILTILFVVSCHYDWQGRVYAQASVGFLFFIVSIIFLIKRGYLTFIKPFRKDYKEALNFGIPLIPHSVSFWIRQGLDRIFINASHSVSVVGLFSFSLNFANIIQIIGAAFNAANSVFIYKSLAKNSEDTHRVLRKQTKLLIIFFVLVTVVVCVGSSVFISFFLPEYSGSVTYLLFQCLGAMFQCIYLLFVNYLFYYKKTKNLMYITFSISVLHALLSYWLTRYSVLYTAGIGALTNFLIMAGVYGYSRRVYKVL